MARIRYFTDEDVYAGLAAQLRSAGFDAVSSREAGRLGEDDESQFMWATSEGRVLVTFNVADFAKIHRDWMNSGQSHCGVVVSAQRPFGDALSRLTQIGNSLSAEEFVDRLEFLGNWQGRR